MAIIEQIGGNVPVQAEGSIKGYRFYFRARGTSWSISIHPTSERGYLGWDDPELAWVHTEEWTKDVEAGWMSRADAMAMIRKGESIFIAKLPFGNQDDLAFLNELEQEVLRLKLAVNDAKVPKFQRLKRVDTAIGKLHNRIAAHRANKKNEAKGAHMPRIRAI